MPFDDEETAPSIQSQKIGLKKVSGQKSVFDSMPKKPSPEQFQEKVKQAADRNAGYKQKAAELATMFNKAMSDRTLVQNRNILSSDAERELLQRMVQLAMDINNDSNELEGMGSLSWITLLLKTCFSQRDKINQLEYAVFQIEKKLDADNLSKLIKKQIDDASGVVDKKKSSE